MFLTLASASVFKAELLAKLGLKFAIFAADIDETKLPDETPETLTQRLSETKAAKVAKTQSGLIIATDQVAVLDGQILGKPGNYDTAFLQLKQSSGRQVIFFTSLTVLNTKSGKMTTKVEKFKVVFRTLTDAQISYYLHQDNPYNAAGSFKSEMLGVALFQRFEGDDPNSLIGLPLMQLVQILESEGVDVLSEKA